MTFILSWIRTPIILFISAIFLTVLSNLSFTLAPSQAQSQTPTNSPPVELKKWQYHWVDLPLDDSRVSRLAEENQLSNSWPSFDLPEKVLNKDRKNTLLLRTSLAQGQWNSPSLYLGGLPNLSGVYLEDKSLSPESPVNLIQLETPSDQWPIVALGSNFKGKNLFLEIDVGESSSIYLGLFNRVMIGSQADVIKLYLQKQIDFVLGSLFIVIGLASALLSYQRQDSKGYLYFGLLSGLIGLYTVSQSPIIKFYINNSVLLDYLKYSSFYLIPVSIYLLFEKLFGTGYLAIIRRLWQTHLIYGIITFSIVINHWDYYWSSLYIDQAFLLISSLILLATAIHSSRIGSRDAKLFISGFIVLILLAIPDIITYTLSLDYWHQQFYPWGTLIFILILGFILERRFNETRKILQVYALELEQKNAALQRLDQLKDEFLANTSHELKTPLNGIIGIAESLMDGVTGQLPQQTIFNLSLIVSSGRRLTQLINDLLDFSQLKHKKIALQIKPVGLREIADIVLRLSQPLVGQKSLQLINKITPDIPPVEADENRLQQILHNLVGNAIKFTESGTVEVSATVVNEQIEITVADTGIGIPSDKLNRIFESFEQGDGSIAREYGGVGLGLAVTKELVQLHGGDIRVESLVGRGSHFTFTLPISKGKVEIKQPEEISKVRDSGIRIVTPDESSIHRDVLVHSEGDFKILIVDDEPVNLQVLVNYLSLPNYAIAQASNGMEALEVIRNGFNPDLILLDIMMPKMTGYEFCQKIREQFLPNELPVVLLTAKNQVSDLVEGFASGANDYLTKPVLKNELLARIKTHIQLAKINVAYGRFIPHEFLRFLERETIIDVQLGDQIQKEMTVLFADIRSFTNLSERMSPKENFDFLNAYLSRVSPVIRNHNGFIDKYIGDAVMALFPKTADDAVQAAIDMQKQVSLYNAERQKNGEVQIAIGIGLHTGSLMLGIVGEPQRLEGTVIADAVNLASRLEGLTKIYGVDILISEQTLARLENLQNYSYRFLGRYKVKGKSQPVEVFEVFDGDPSRLKESKMQTRDKFEQGVALFLEEKFAEAQEVFQQVLVINQSDRVTQLYIERCKKAQRFGISELNIIIS